MVYLFVVWAVGAYLTAKGDMEVKTEVVNLPELSLQVWNPISKSKGFLFGKQFPDLTSNKTFNPHVSPVPVLLET
jgi:hypothetical protein